MIISLLYVGLLCMGVGAKASTPINLNDNRNSQKQQRQTNDTTNSTYTLNLNYPQSEYVAFNTITPYSTYGFTHDHFTNLNGAYASFKSNQSGHNEMINVNANIYDQNITIRDPDVANSTLVAVQNDYTWQETTSLVAMTVTTYGLATDTTVSIQFNLLYELDNFTSPDEGDFHLRSIALSSIDNNFAQFQDISNYYTYRKNAEIYNALTSSENGYDYVTNYNDTVVHCTDEIENRQVTTSNNITIVAGKVNYIYIYLIPWYTSQYFSPGDYGYGKFNMGFENQSQNIFKSNRRIQIIGEYVPPISNYEVVDIPGMMWEIISMPFAFISTAFNLTLFPGTPYQINIANLVLMLFGIMVFIFIFKLLLRR